MKLPRCAARARLCQLKHIVFVLVLVVVVALVWTVVFSNWNVCRDDLDDDVDALNSNSAAESSKLRKMLQVQRFSYVSVTFSQFYHKFRTLEFLRVLLSFRIRNFALGSFKNKRTRNFIIRTSRKRGHFPKFTLRSS